MENREGGNRHVVYRFKLLYAISRRKTMGVKVGLPLSDEQGTMGFPYAVVANTPRLVDELCAVSSRRIDWCGGYRRITEARGDEKSITKERPHLGDSLRCISQKQTFYESEAFTSAEGASCTHESGETRAPKARRDIDASAANALILTSYPPVAALLLDTIYLFAITLSLFMNTFAPRLRRAIALPFSGIDLSTSGVKAVRLAKEAHGLMF